MRDGRRLGGPASINNFKNEQEMQYKLKDGTTMPERLGIAKDRLKKIISACIRAERCAHDPSTPNMTQSDVMVRVMNELQPSSIEEAVFIGHCTAKASELYNRAALIHKLFS